MIFYLDLIVFQNVLILCFNFENRVDCINFEIDFSILGKNKCRYSDKYLLYPTDVAYYIENSHNLSGHIILNRVQSKPFYIDMFLSIELFYFCGNDLIRVIIFIYFLLAQLNPAGNISKHISCPNSV